MSDPSGHTDLILTGASRGIGRALALALAAPGLHMTLLARDGAALAAVAAEVRARGAGVAVAVCDLNDVAAAAAAGAALVDVARGAVLVHNAGLWPSRRELVRTAWGAFERAYVVNHLAPLALQQPLLAQPGALARVVVVSAGLIALGRFQPAKTPVGEDFSSLKTYAHTKLCFAAASRVVARAHPSVDVVALHPGVARTDLGTRGGLLGAVLKLVKRNWEDPAITGARVARVMSQPERTPGVARYFVEETPAPWPSSAVAAEVDVAGAARALGLL